MMHARDESEGRIRRDIELGSVMRAWVDSADIADAEVLGPLEAPGMVPRWILTIRRQELEADVYLFLGPSVDVSAFRPSDPDGGGYVGSEEQLSDARLIEMLDDLASASLGGPLPDWLRSVAL